MEAANLSKNIIVNTIDINEYIAKQKIRINDCRKDINYYLNIIKEIKLNMNKSYNGLYFISYAKSLLKSTMAETEKLKTKLAYLLKILKLFESERVKRQKNPYHAIKFEKLYQAYYK